MRNARPPLGILVPAGFVFAVVACAATALIFPAGARIPILAAAVAAYALWARHLTAALATAATTWSLATGFLVNTLGELTFTRADLTHLAAFGAAGLIGVLLSSFRHLRPVPYMFAERVPLPVPEQSNRPKEALAKRPQTVGG
ncbi:hypothetical protein [Acrocarpospora corrugata]|nr:hypothetical protein [Acrocarpospora corrugata]